MRDRVLPAPTGDITTVADVHDLVVEFYREVVFDELLEPVFGEVAEVDWAEHIPKLIDYWARILLGAPGTAGPVMATHRHLHAMSPLTAEHCDRWFMLWTECVDQGWSGPNADRATSHAASLMAGMAKHLFGFAWTPATVPVPAPVPAGTSTTAVGHA